MMMAFDHQGVKYYAFNASSMRPTQKKILSFMTLPKGWRYGQGAPATIQMATTAQSIEKYFTFSRAEKTDAFMIVDGSIQVLGFFGQLRIEVTANVNSTFDVGIEWNGEDVLEETFPNLASVFTTIDSWRLRCLDLLDSSTLVNIPRQMGALTQMQCAPWVLVPQFSTWTAPSTTAKRAASTQTSDTKPSSAIQPLSGNSMINSFLRAHA